MAKDQPEGSPGLGVDSRGDPAVDPTKNVRELVEAAMQRQDDLRDGAKSLFKAMMDGVQKYIDSKIDGNDRLSTERHEFTRRELSNIEQRRLEHKEDTRSTVDTAFAGAEKAIAKSERAAADQIKSVESTVDDLKDRVLRLETTQQTKTETRSDGRSNIGMVVGILGAIFGFLMLATVVITNLMRGAG